MKIRLFLLNLFVCDHEVGVALLKCRLRTIVTSMLQFEVLFAEKPEGRCVLEGHRIGKVESYGLAVKGIH